MKQYFFMIIFFTLFLFGNRLSIADDSDYQIQSFDFQNDTRTYYLHSSSNTDKSTALPLIIALHATASSGFAMAGMTDLNQYADEQGFVVAYPNSKNLAWNNTQLVSEQSPDDSGFILSLITHLSARYAIDKERIYLIGFDSGGAMSYHLACQSPQTFAGIAIVGAMIGRSEMANCAELTPFDLLMVAGERDSAYTLNARSETSIHNFLEKQLTFWSSRHQCDAEKRIEESWAISYQDCAEGSRIAFYKIANGGHRWYQPDDYQNDGGVDTTEIVLDFLFGRDSWKNQRDAVSQETPRSYSIYVPSNYDNETPLPLVVLLHGFGGNGVGIVDSTNMNIIAEQEGFILALPDALPDAQNAPSWNYTRGLSELDTEPQDDAQFILAMIEDIAQDFKVDRERVYATGVSNGGYMTERLACEVADSFTAFAVVVAGGFAGMDKLCASQPPSPILYIIGTQDPIVLWDGLIVPYGDTEVVIFWTMDSTIGFWASHNGCDIDNPLTSELPILGNSPDTSVTRFEAQDCSDNSALVVYVVVGGGHSFPGIDWGNPSLIGRVNMDFQANQTIWEFFEQQVKYKN